MYAGQLFEIGGASEIHHEPAHPYTKGLLNSFPSVRGPRRELAGIPGSPPDLHVPPPGCSFLPRCGYGTQACATIDIRLAPVSPAKNLGHVTACPFVQPETPLPARSADLSPAGPATAEPATAGSATAGSVAAEPSEELAS
jgi:peptide/nickel transport system ATP-binding protein